MATKLTVTYQHYCPGSCTTPGLEVEHIFHVFAGNYVHLVPVHCVDTGCELRIVKRVKE